MPFRAFISNLFLIAYFVIIESDSVVTDEGAGYGGTFLELITLANGIIILVIGIISWIISFRTKQN